jgi:hypothetical protein
MIVHQVMRGVEVNDVDSISKVLWARARVLNIFKTILLCGLKTSVHMQP